VRLHPPFSFRLRRKENGRCTVQKKRRFGGSVVASLLPPAAGGGWLAGSILSVRDGNALLLTLGSAGCKTGIDCTSIPARYALLWEVEAGWFFYHLQTLGHFPFG